jgi:DnaJ-class molecular chaperone
MARGRPKEENLTKKVSCPDCRGKGKLACACVRGCRKHPAYPCPQCDGKGYKIKAR